MPDLKNKKVQQVIYIIFVTGIALLFLAKLDTGTAEKREPAAEPAAVLEESLEERMEKLLKTVEGVGDVKVVINYSSSASKVIAKDKTEETGQDTKRFQENVVLGSNDQPIVLRENSKEIQGVLIAAQGGGNAVIKSRLISAAQALLGVEAHKIEVLKMRS